MKEEYCSRILDTGSYVMEGRRVYWGMYCVGQNMKEECCSRILDTGSHVMEGRRVYWGMCRAEYEGGMLQ